MRTHNSRRRTPMGSSRLRRAFGIAPAILIFAATCAAFLSPARAGTLANFTPDPASPDVPVVAWNYVRRLVSTGHRHGGIQHHATDAVFSSRRRLERQRNQLSRREPADHSERAQPGRWHVERHSNWHSRSQYFLADVDLWSIRCLQRGDTGLSKRPALGRNLRHRVHHRHVGFHIWLAGQFQRGLFLWRNLECGRRVAN